MKHIIKYIFSFGKYLSMLILCILVELCFPSLKLHFSDVLPNDNKTNICLVNVFRS